MRVDVWTIDEPDEVQEMLDAGVDGVMTDRPDLLAKVRPSSCHVSMWRDA